jgi:hypothetical protein
MTAEPASAAAMPALVVDPATHAGEIARFLRRASYGAPIPTRPTQPR